MADIGKELVGNLAAPTPEMRQQAISACLTAATSDRLTVKTVLYHQQPGEQPTQVERSYSRSLATKDQPYSHKIDVGDAALPVPMETGWIQNPANIGTVVIQNEEGFFLQTNPTQEQKDEAAKKVLELFTMEGTPPILIYPREDVRICPSDYSKLRIRCQSGSAKFTLWLFPR